MNLHAQVFTDFLFSGVSACVQFAGAHDKHVLQETAILFLQATYVTGSEGRLALDRLLLHHVIFLINF